MSEVLGARIFLTAMCHRQSKTGTETGRQNYVKNSRKLLGKAVTVLWTLSVIDDEERHNAAAGERWSILLLPTWRLGTFGSWGIRYYGMSSIHQCVREFLWAQNVAPEKSKNLNASQKQKILSRLIERAQQRTVSYPATQL